MYRADTLQNKSNSPQFPNSKIGKTVMGGVMSHITQNRYVEIWSIQVWVKVGMDMIPCSLVDSYQAFGGYCLFLTFIGPCIAIHSYSTTNKMHLFLKLFILVKRSTCFGRSFRPSPGAKNCIYGIRHTSNSCGCLAYLCVPIRMPEAVCAVLSSWWRTERPSETCRAFYKNK